MKIATLNIDWGGKAKKKNHYLEIEAFLNALDFDFLVITEAIDLNLVNYPYKYFTEQIPENTIYESLNYTSYLKGEKAFRSIIYSKTKCIKEYDVQDKKTNLAVAFESPFGEIVFYSTIVGTWFNRQPFAQQELENTIADCKRLYQSNKNLFIVGDLNTSFRVNEKSFSINPETTTSLLNLFNDLNLCIATQNLKQNIDHIVLPQNLENNIIKQSVFVEKDVLSDHQGVFVELKV